MQGRIKKDLMELVKIWPLTDMEGIYGLEELLGDSIHKDQALDDSDLYKFYKEMPRAIASLTNAEKLFCEISR